MEEITYRPATVADVETLAELRWEMEAERNEGPITREEYIPAFLRDTRPGMESGIYRSWLAEADGVPIACVLLIWFPMPPNKRQPHRKRGFVSSVYTRPEYRRQGIARRLMEMLLDYAREQRIQRLILWASDMGRPLYEALGFEPSRGMDINLE